MTRRLMVDGIDSLDTDPRATLGLPDGWGWDWQQWNTRRRG